MRKLIVENRQTHIGVIACPKSGRFLTFATNFPELEIFQVNVERLHAGNEEAGEAFAITATQQEKLKKTRLWFEKKIDKSGAKTLGMKGPRGRGGMGIKAGHMVGDVTVDDAIAAVAGTFGALPARAPAAQPAPGASVRRFPAGTPEPVVLKHTGPGEQGLAYIAWPTTDSVIDRTEARTIQILGEVMSLRATEEIRERLAIAYSPGVGASTSDTFTGYGSIFVQALTRPESFTAFYDAVNAIVASLRDTPITEDELNRARLPEVERLKRSQAGNEYWLGQLSGVAANPADVDQILTHVSDLEAITVADIQRAARQYLRAETAWRGVSVSDNPAAPAAAQ